MSERCPKCGLKLDANHSWSADQGRICHHQEPERWGVLARRLNASQFGGATAWCHDKGGTLLFATKDEALRQAADYNARTVSPNVSYVAARFR